MLVELDVRGRQEGRRPKPDGEPKVVLIDENLDHTTQINKSLLTLLKQGILTLLKKNANLFA